MTLEGVVDEVLESQQKTIHKLRKRLEELEHQKVARETQETGHHARQPDP